MDNLQNRIKELMESNFTIGQTAEKLYSEGYAKSETDEAITKYINEIASRTDVDELI